MKHQNKLRNTLRGYYDHQEYSVSENDWQQASTLLRAEKQKRRFRIFAGIFGGLLFLFSLLLVLLSNTTESTGIQTHQVLVPSNKKAKQLTPAKTDFMRIPVVSRKDTSSGQEPVNYPSRALVQTFTSGLIPGSTISEGETNLVAINNLSITADNLDKKNRLDLSSTQNTIKDQAVNDHDSLINPSVLSEDDDLPHTAGNGIQPEMQHELVSNKERITVLTETLSQLQNHIPIGEPLQSPAGVLLQTTTSAVLTENENEITQVNSAGKVNVSRPSETSLTVITDTSCATPTMDTAAISVITGSDTLVMLGSFNKLVVEGVFLDLGLNWTYGWKGSVTRDARGFSPAAAINYMDQLTYRTAFSIGLSYWSVLKLSNSSKTSRVSTYEYGELSSVTVIRPNALHYLAIPLRLHYYANLKNSFVVGVNVAYLLNVYATVTSYKELPGFSENYKTTKFGGFTEGFSSFDTQLAFGYRRRLSNSIALHGEVFLGLTDVKQDDFFGFKNKDRNSGGKLSLIYYAFKKNSR